jgi:hypothetical protein
VSESEPFYMPSPDLFRHADAYRMFTSYASKLEEAGLRDRFPADADLRHIAIELLAEREPVENVEEDLELIEDAIAEARGILKSSENRDSALPRGFVIRWPG